jgi:hypothetical protein
MQRFIISSLRKEKRVDEEKGSMMYCTCGAFVGSTTPPPDYGKTVVIAKNICEDCAKRGNMLERSEHD